MARYGAQSRSNVLRRPHLSQSKTVGEDAAEFGLSTATIYGRKGKMNDGSLRVDEGAQGARQRQLSERSSLLLESGGLTEEKLGSAMVDIW